MTDFSVEHEIINTPGAAESEEESEDNSDETDDEFEWFNPKDQQIVDDTYFTFVNKTRRTIQPGEQVYYCYGNRSNKFLLLNYGFCFPDNNYESYELPMRVDLPFDSIKPEEMVDFKFISK